MAFHPGDRVEPVATDDPFTRLWTGDRIRKLPEDPTSSHTDPAPGPTTQRPIHLAGRRPPSDPTGRRLSC